MRGRPAKWQRGPDGKYLKDRYGNYIPIDQGSPPEAVQHAPNNPPPKIQEAPAVLTAHYASMADALHAAQFGAPQCAANAQMLENARSRKDAEWFGMDKVVGLSYLVALANGGWSKGAKRLFDSQDKISVPKVEALSRKLEYRDQGESICLDRLYAGEFDTMWRGFKPIVKSGRSRVVKVVYGLACSGAQSSESLFWSGAACTVLVDALCKAGYAVQVEGSIMGHNLSQEEFDVRVMVKGSDDPLSITNMAATLCLSGFFRCIGHCLSTMIATKEIRDYGFFPHYNPPEGMIDEGDLWVSPNVASNQAQAIEWINERIAEFA
jgi:hypothetical protein